MKMMYNKTPVKTMKVKHYELSTNDATLVASDLQAGVTAYAKGQKVTGTGKSFEFARYGQIYTNVSTLIPATINIIEIASLSYPVQLSVALNDMYTMDFSTLQTIGSIVIDGTTYPLSAVVLDGKLTIACDKTTKLQIFYGKDNYR